MLTRIKLTLKQHRFETIAITVVCVVLTAGALIEAYRLSSLNVPISCFNGSYEFSGLGTPTYSAGAHCQALVDSFMGLQNGAPMNLVRIMLLLAPLLAGIVLGAPLVAREIEQGTAPLSWALSGSRRRWLLGKVLAGVVLLVPLMLAVGLAAEVLEGASDPGVDTHAAFQNYLGRGSFDVFWALAAFAGTVTLGTLFGRTMPALIVALIVCVFVRVTWDPGMARIVLRPMAVERAQMQGQFQTFYGGGNGIIIAPIGPTPSSGPSPSSEPSPSGGPSPSSGPTPSSEPSGPIGVYTPNWVQTDLYSYTQVFLDGKPFYGDPYTLPGFQMQLDANGNPIQPDPSTMPNWVNYAIPGSQYWPVVALESGFLLLGSLFCGAIAFVWVDRRRPY